MNIFFQPVLAQAGEDIIWLVFLVLWALFQVFAGSKKVKKKQAKRAPAEQHRTADEKAESEDEYQEARRTREIQEEIRRRIEERRRMREAEGGQVPSAPPQPHQRESETAHEWEREPQEERTPSAPMANSYEKAYQEQMRKLEESRAESQRLMRKAREKAGADITEHVIEETEIGSAEIGTEVSGDFWSSESAEEAKAFTNNYRHFLMDDLSDPRSLRKAILLTEILGPCKSNQR